MRISDWSSDVCSSDLILFRLAEPGEVLAAGGRVATLLDLTDVYMTVFMPSEVAGRIAVGADARIVLDAASGTPVPGKVSFVSPRAPFTPKEVETRSERDRMMKIGRASCRERVCQLRVRSRGRRIN